MVKRDKYLLGELDLYDIRNRNESRVVKGMRQVLEHYQAYPFETLDFQDIYALALNNLPPRYVQNGSIVIQDPVTDEMILTAVREAVEIVMQSPNHA